MELLKTAIDFVLHLDVHLTDLMHDFGAWTYGILFLIVFVETGVVVMPFLPGDSLLFAAGTLCALDNSPLQIGPMLAVLFVAAVLGDTVNYHIGKFIGPRAFTSNSRWLKRKHLDRTHQFFEKYGGKTIIIARFVPIVRTFAPFVAGIGAMTYSRFIIYNVLGGALWVLSLTLAGYWFGNVPIVKENFTLVILAIIVISILPGVVEIWRARRAAGKTAAEARP